MHNNEKAKDLLLQVLRNLPNDFALTEVRQHVKLAMAKLEQVDAKREKRAATQAELWQQTLSGGLNNPYNPKQTLAEIENMISQEKTKIKDIQERRKKVEDDPDTDHRVSTILG